MIELRILFFLIEVIARFASNKIESTIARNKNIHGSFIQIMGELEHMKAFQVEDLIDQFVALVQSRAGGGLLGAGHNVLHYPVDMTRASVILTDVGRVRDIILGISQMRNQLEFKGSSGEGPSRRRTEFPAELPRFDEGEHVLGVERNKELLMRWLMPPTSANDRQRKRRVVSVWGMGGLGKTTLVREVYHHPTVKRWFKTHVWVSVSKSYKIDDLLRSMVHELQGGGAMNRQELQEGGGSPDDTHAMISKISKLLHQKSYLIVLDDVCNDKICKELFEYLPSNMHGSRILVTTRNKEVADSVSDNGHVLEISPLSDADAHILFNKAVFGGATCPPELDIWAQMMLNKCKGLPLAILAIGRVMAGKPSTSIAWKDMCQHLEWELSNNEILGEMARTLMLSYKNLPYHLQRCFLYCSLFKEGQLIKTKWLIRMWIAEGFIVEQNANNNSLTMEEIGVRYAEQLAARSPLQVVKKDAAGRPKVCRVHDIMKDLALTASKGENLCATNVNQLANLGQSCRRLSIMKNLGDVVNIKLHLSNIRTLLVFTNDPSFSASLMRVCTNLKFLRVLDLRGAPINDVPSNIFELFNLRYLSLRGTNISKIPPTVKKLYNLQTLDLWKTKVTELPRRILKLQHLRHLYKEDIFVEDLKYKNIGEIPRGARAPLGISDLRNLQTLKTIKASQKALAELRIMTQLRDLGITELNASDGTTLCNSISIMERLHRLFIKASDTQLLELDGLSPPADLHKLILNGRLHNMPVWFSSLHSLTHLYLFNSWLKENESPVPSLGSLPNLVVLALDDNAYQGRILHFNSGDFRRLETLFLSNLKGLSELNVEERGLASLQVVYLRQLSNLKVVKGIKYIATMHTLHLREMPITLKFDPSELKHIPSVEQFSSV